MRIIIASNNKHKVEEIKDMMAPLGFEVMSMKDAGIVMEVDEDQDSFRGNALKKATELFESLSLDERKNTYVLSDDSGLSVDILHGAPGVYSARYSGEGATDSKNNEKLLNELSGVAWDERTARFICAMALIGEEKEVIVQGETPGIITFELKGEGGFGYDPMFYSLELNKTFGESLPEEKNAISHRGKALALLVKELSLEERE